MVKIAIVYYSMYGHIRILAEAIKKGVEEAGHEAVLLQVPETLPDDVLAKMHAPAKSDDAVVTVADLLAYDGIIFGLSGRFGQVPAQFRSFWDATGGHWQTGALIGKPAGVFSSTGSQGGGQETIGLTLIPQLAHHGMVFVPLGYRDKRAFDNTEGARRPPVPRPRKSPSDVLSNPCGCAPPLSYCHCSARRITLRCWDNRER